MSVVHRWNIHVVKGGAPHLCNPKPHWFHGTKNCCTIKREEITCIDCLEKLKLEEEQYGARND